MNGRRILVPVDLEKSNSFESLEFVAKLSTEMPVFATVLYVLNLSVVRFENRIYDELRHENERRLGILAAPFFSGRLPCVRVRVGKPHQEIVLEAESLQTELIVLGGRKPRRTTWPFYSTTVERVVRDAPCLTLVLPGMWKIAPERYRQMTGHAAIPAAEPEAAGQCG